MSFRMNHAHEERVFIFIQQATEESATNLNSFIQFRFVTCVDLNVICLFQDADSSTISRSSSSTLPPTAPISLQGRSHSTAVVNSMGRSTAAIDGWRWGSMKPGMMTWSLKVSSISWSYASSHGAIFSKVPTSTMRPSRTATASAVGIDASIVRTRRAVKTVISAMPTPPVVALRDTLALIKKRNLLIGSDCPSAQNYFLLAIRLGQQCHRDPETSSEFLGAALRPLPPSCLYRH